MRFAVLLLLSHLIVAVVVYLTAMPPTARLLVLPMILSSLFYYLARDVLLFFAHSWHEILLDQDSSVSVVTRNGLAIHGCVANKTVVNPFFVLLRVRLEGQRMPVSRVIFPDTLDAGLFRELCVHLKFALQPA